MGIPFRIPRSVPIILPTKRNLITTEERKDLRIVSSSVRISCLILNVPKLFFLENIAAGDIDAVVRDAKDHLPFVATDEVVGYDALYGVVQKGGIFGVEEAGPEIQDVVDVILAKTSISCSGTLIMTIVIMATGRS